MSNVIKLVPPAPPSEPTPVNDVVAQLRVLLELAEAGNIASFAYVAIGDGKAAPAVGFSGGERNALSAGIPMLAQELMWKVQHG
jgi:hypothetical protein